MRDQHSAPSASSRRESTARVLARYALFQIPGWAAMAIAAEAAVLWFGVPARWAWGAFGLWVAKDVAMFPLVRRAYDWSHSRPPSPSVS